MEQFKQSHYVPLFIHGFKKKYGESTQDFFLEWGCKLFSDILIGIYWGEQLHYLCHYITKIDNRYWDITWEIFPEEKNIDKPWFCEEIEKSMSSYNNIFEIVIFDIFKK